MKPNPTRINSRRASALITVVVLTAIMAVTTGSMLRYTLTERRGNERNRVVLRAKNMSESISVYVAEQITTKLYRLRSASPIGFTTGANAIDMPPLDFLQAADPTYVSGANMEARAGLTGATGLVFIDPATEPSNPNAGLQVNTAAVPIIAKATARHTALGNITSYSQHNLAIDFVPLFQFAVFYNMDMEIWPGADMILAGPVHCNGELSARSSTGFTANVQFLERVSSSKGFYAESIRQGTWINNVGGTDAGPGGNGPLRFQHSTTGTVTDIQSSGSVWRDHKYGSSTETTTTQNNFKVFATTSYGLNLRTSAHGVTPLVLPGVSNYSKVNLPSTPEDDRDNGRQIIARPAATDTAGLKETKISRKAGLYIIVNPDNVSRTGYMPDGTAVTMRARSYRCWLNTVNANLSHTMYEVILPGQPSYGNLNANVNNLPNRYTTLTSIGHNQVLRTIQGGSPDEASTGYTVGAAPTMASFSDAYFYDLRRAKNNSGAGSQLSTGSFRSANPYTPRPIVKIDLDLTRFRMAVERTISGTTTSYVATATTSSIYNPAAPNATNWSSSIYNSASSAAPASYGLGLGGSFNTFPTSTTLNAQDPYRIYFAPADPADALITSDPGKFAVGSTDLVSANSPKPWFDGVTIYIHSVDAEVRGDTDLDGNPDRIDSAVRLWNGRGRVVSLDGATYPGRTGFTFVTNDAAYIVGHFNADGTINATSTDVTNPGGYSARYPDSTSETLCSVMADAVTILSMPAYTNTTAPYTQTSGWSDSLSAHRGSSSNWSSSWATTQPSSSNASDGTNTSFSPAAMPNQGNTVAGSGGARNMKFGATATEISTCLLVGIVPTNHNANGLSDGPPVAAANGQASGGVHNFPRLLEIWGGAGLYIRGSMVAMFESRVAMEPWSLRVYSAPGRFWGLHQGLRSANHDLPLEPILLGARRQGFKEITAAEYNTMKTTIEALPN
jgi:hypothetical protein